MLGSQSLLRGGVRGCLCVLGSQSLLRGGVRGCPLCVLGSQSLLCGGVRGCPLGSMCKAHSLYYVGVYVGVL